MLLKIPATRTPQGALKFVALIIKILSCNKKKYFMVYDQNYHNCSTLAFSCVCGHHMSALGLWHGEAGDRRRAFCC
jgi:hypothetical protein